MREREGEREVEQNRASGEHGKIDVIMQRVKHL